MEADESLAQQVQRGAPPTVRVYGWKYPAITIGRRQRPEDLPKDLLRQGLPIVRRPTGGGAVVHCLDELTYSLAASRSSFPKTIRLHQMTQFLHERLRDTLLHEDGISREELSLAPAVFSVPPTLCFLTPVCGDLLYRGEKVAGAALRAGGGVLLVQGSIQGLPVPHPVLTHLLVRAINECACN